MRISDLNYLSEIVGVDREKVGHLLNTGVHHRVYSYGDEHVIKVPRRRFNFLYTERAHLEADLNVIDTYFPGLRVNTDVLSSPDHQRHCIIQERLHDYRLLTPASFSEHRPAFSKIWKTNQRLLAETGKSLDFVGGEGLSSCLASLMPAAPPPFFSNMVIQVQGSRTRLRLIDTELLCLGVPPLNHTDILRVVLSWISWGATVFCLRWFFRIHR